MRFTFALLSFFIAIVFAQTTYAQQPNPFGAQAPLAAGTKKPTTSLKAERAIKVNYGSFAWNKDPKSIDSASVILREGKTDKILQVYLEETEPDSAMFSGIYRVSWENLQDLNPQFYVAPAELLGKYSEIKDLKKLITEGKLIRKPFIFRRSGKQQIIEIYDTTEQAKLAYQAFSAEKEALQLANKKIVSEATADANLLALSVEKRKAIARFAQERIRLQQIEAQRRANKLKEFARLSSGDRNAKKVEAARLAKEADESYRANDFKTAATKFEQALDLDPESDNLYFRYGVSLYRLDQANKAIVLIEMSKENSAERFYYLGLAYYKIEDFPNAFTHFTTAANAKNVTLSPSAEFYRGLILVDQKKFDDATASFQKVLDTSNDPKLDERAEQMIERIQQLKSFEAEKARKWSASALIGEMYDSNVLGINDASTTGSATNLVGYRSVVAVGVKYRPVYDSHREFAITADALHIYTVDDSFKQRSDLRQADPTLLTVTTPFTIKSVAFDKGNKLDIKPGYEGLMSSVEDDIQKVILHSGFLAFDDTIVLSEKTLGSAKAEIRYDSSQLNSSTGTADLSAIKYKLFVGALTFVSPDRTKMVMGNLGYTLNAAQGRDVKYNRYDLEIGYIAPWLWDVTYNAKLNYYFLTYPEQTGTKRIDNDVTLTLAGSKKINAVLSAGLTGTYTYNDSTNTGYDYSKYTVLASMSANWDF